MSGQTAVLIAEKNVSLKIIIDQNAGPCGGVKRVIRLTEESLDKGHKTVSLGKVIHNQVEIDRLEAMGLSEVDHGVLDRVAEGNTFQNIVVRAHGEPEAVFQRAKELGVEMIDGTCPVVTRSQRYASKYHVAGYQVVIIGKPKHAEVIGIQGYCDNEVKVVHDVADIDALDPTQPTYVLAQTTISHEMWTTLLGQIEAHVADVTSRNTICAFVADRELELRDFANSCDVILFIGGRNSSNTQVLYDVCRTVNSRSHWIETAREIEDTWLEGAETVGISGSASTPQWLLEHVADILADRLSAPKSSSV